MIANALSAGFVPVHPSCLGGPGGVKGSGHEVEALEGGLVGREVTSGADGPAEAGVQALDRVRGADDPADLDVVEPVAECGRGLAADPGPVWSRWLAGSGEPLVAQLGLARCPVELGDVEGGGGELGFVECGGQAAA